MKKEVIAHKNPKSPISEIFRTLRTNIQFMNTNKKMKTLLVTSTFPSEGKSWVTANLAVTFAQTGKRVILVDADMRKGRQYAIFGIAPRPGLSNFLAKTEIDRNDKLTEDITEYLQETEIENLYVLAAGNIPPNPSELLVSGQMYKVLDELKEICDIVIIDGTPSELVTDAVILSRMADATIIVTAHKITKKDALARVIKNIKNVGGKIAGIVINKVPVSTRKYGERYYYYGNSKTFGEKQGQKDIETAIDNKKRALDTLNIDRKYDQNEIDDKNEAEQKNIEENIPVNLENISSDIDMKEEQEDSNKKTNDILQQINSYLEEEKKNL